MQHARKTGSHLRTTRPKTYALALSTLAALGLAAFPQAAQAQTTVNFENLANPTSTGANYSNIQGASVTQNGFTVAAGGALLESIAPNPPLGNYTGSVAIFNDGVGTLTTLTANNAAPFSLNSISIANLNPQRLLSSGAVVLFTGTLQGGGTVSQSLTLAASDALQTFQFLPAFTNLSSVSFVETAGAAQYDNIRLTPAPAASTVPEPSSVAAFAFTGLGAAGLILRARKRLAPTA